MVLNKKIIAVLFLCCVFIVGTFGVLTVDATNWKKFDSGKISTEYPSVGYKKVIYFQAFTKGENKLYYEAYFFPKNASAKKLAFRVKLTKKNDVITEKTKDYFSKEKEINYVKTKWSVKKFYKNSKKDIIKFSTTPADKLAF